MSEWKLVDVEGIGSGYACLTLDGVSTTKSRNLIQADRGAGGDGLGFSDLGTLLIDYADRDIAGVVEKPAGARKSTFILTPQRGGGVKVLLRYFLTRK